MYVDRPAGRVTFKAYAEDWLKAQTFVSSTREDVELGLRKHIYPVLGSKTLEQISRQRSKAGSAGCPSSLRLSAHGVGQRVCDPPAAVDDEKIAKNPCHANSVRTPKADARKARSVDGRACCGGPQPARTA